LSRRVDLRCHPDTSEGVLTGIGAEVARRAPRRLEVLFVLFGETWKIDWPEPETRGRADGLWQKTCLELFLRAGDDDAYLEYNIIPAGQWAAYRFDRYRERMEPLEGVEEPVLLGGTERREPITHEKAFRMEKWGFEAWERFKAPFLCIKVGIDLINVTWLATDIPWYLGLSAVIHESNGHVSYWALAHPPGAPDFHHPDCFRLKLPPPRRA
jgi:hypothetical protein